MTDKILVALISGGIALVGVAISALVSWLTVRTAIRTKKLELYGGFSQNLYSERLESHSIGFELASRIQQLKKPKRINDSFELHEIGNELEKWSNGRGGLLMSGTTLNLTRDLAGTLKKQPENGERYSKAQAEKIWKLRNDLRKSLRNDLHVLTPSDKWTW